MSWRYEHRGNVRPATIWAFVVVAKSQNIYCPVSVMTEMPTKDEDWTWVGKLWVADTVHHMYNFLTKKDAESRCKLEADMISAIEKNNQERLWFRNYRNDIKGKPKLVSEIERKDKLRDLATICHPYTTFGMKECIFREVPSGHGNKTLFKNKARWAQDSLRTTFAASSDSSIVVFDITDLDNVALAVLDRARDGTRRVATIKEHCEDEINRFKDDYRPVMEALVKVPFIHDKDISQLLTDTADLRDQIICKQGYASLPTQVPDRMKCELDRARACAAVKGTTLYNLTLTDSTVLTMDTFTRGLMTWPQSPAISTLSFPDRLLLDSDGEETPSFYKREALINVLRKMDQLKVVYITESPGIPSVTMNDHLPAKQHALAQGNFFEQVRHMDTTLADKVSGSSMYSWKLSPMLQENLHVLGKVLEGHVDRFFKK
ncbi:hypothetical protein MY4038_007366 [Beauveria bassiana]